MKKNLLKGMFVAALLLVGTTTTMAQKTWTFKDNAALWNVDLMGGNQFDENAELTTSGGVTFTGTQGFVATAKGIGFKATGSVDDENISIVVPAGYKATVKAYTSGNRTIVGSFGEATQTFNAGWASSTKEFNNAEGTTDVTLYLYCNQNPGGSDQSKAPFLEEITLVDMASVNSFHWTANAVATIDGTKTTIKTYQSEGTVDEGSQYTITVEKIIEFGGAYYELKDSKFAENVYGATYTMGSTEPAHEFTYEAISDVVFYGEVENIFVEGNRANKIQNVSILSNGGGYTGQGTEGYVKLGFTVPADGNYNIALGMNNTNDKSRGFNYAIDDAEVSETITVNAGTAFVQEMKDEHLAAGEHTLTLNITYSLTPVFDYLLITKGSDDTVGISAVNAQSNAQGTIFNLAGQKVQNAQKGLYIQNGKKYIVK